MLTYKYHLFMVIKTKQTVLTHVTYVFLSCVPCVAMNSKQAGKLFRLTFTSILLAERTFCPFVPKVANVNTTKLLPSVPLRGIDSGFSHVLSKCYNAPSYSATQMHACAQRSYSLKYFIINNCKKDPS